MIAQIETATIIIRYQTITIVNTGEITQTTTKVTVFIGEVIRINIRIIIKVMATTEVTIITNGVTKEEETEETRAVDPR